LEALGLADGALWQIVERGLRKNPDERWETMSDLYAALAEWLTARGVLEDASGAALRVQPSAERVEVEAPDSLFTMPFFDVASPEDEDSTLDPRRSEPKR